MLKTRPRDIPNADNFSIETTPIPEPEEGQVLVRVHLVALSPWQGQRLKDFKNFTQPFAIGELIDCDILGEIIASRSPTLSVGQRVTGRLGWQEYALASPNHLSVVSDRFPDTDWLTALSSPGLTAYTAFDICARPMPGQTLAVTSAAGAVGAYAVQLGKLASMRVVGIAGSAEKCNFVRAQLGADHALSYQSVHFAGELAEACPDGVHLCFDTVGGHVADAVFDNLAKYASVLIVGRTMSNNSPTPEIDHVNMRQLWAREARIHCFSRYSYPERFAFAKERMADLLRRGLIKPTENVIDGFESTPQALGDMLSGRYTGKVLVRYTHTT